MGAELIINMKCFALVQRNCRRSLLVFLETQERSAAQDTCNNHGLADVRI